MGVGKMGQIIGDMGVGEMGVSEMGVIRQLDPKFKKNSNSQG